MHRDRIRAHRERFDPRVAARVELGMSVAAADYIVMQDRRRDWIGRVEGALEGFDALLCPTVPIVAPASPSDAFDAALDAARIAAVLRANGVVDVDPYRKLGRNQLRIATFASVPEADVEALLACIDWTLENALS